MTNRRTQREVGGGERYRNSELLLKRLGQGFIFLCQIFLDFPLRRKLTGVSSELRLLPCTPPSLSLFSPYNLFFHFIVSLFSSFYHRIPVFVFLTELLSYALSCYFCCLCLEFCLFYFWELIASFLPYLPFLSFSPCYSSQRPIHRLLAFINTIHFSFISVCLKGFS